jgi:phage gpG-like protein
MSLNDRWFKEDRELYKGNELKEQIEQADKAIRNSSLFSRRLKRMLEEDLEKAYQVEEDFENPAWQRKTIAAAAERKVLRRIIKLLP